MRLWLGLVLAGVLLIAAGLARVALQSSPAAEPISQSASPKNGAPKSATPASPSSPPPVLQIPGDIPTGGPGTFVYGTTSGPILGTAGILKRFRVAVESNLDAELAEFGAAFDQTLGDPRGWIAGGRRFQRVPQGLPHDFTVYLVTRETAYQMCRVNGVDIRQNGVPYTSCRQVHKVIINVDRWRLSVPDFVNGGVPLRTYREYVINHEVGHELGRGHQACPGAGRPAPVMQTQTLGLKQCTANPWPYVDGRLHTGPPAP